MTKYDDKLKAPEGKVQFSDAGQLPDKDLSGEPLVKALLKSPIIWAAIITSIVGLVGVISGHLIDFVGTKYNTDIPLTAQANATHVAAMIQAGEQNPEKKTYDLPLILPAGHTPPNSVGGAYPNAEAYREAYKKLPLRIQIPSISVDAPVVQGDGWEALTKGVGQVLGTSYPGETGVIILSAYNDIFGEIFRDLDKLKKGNTILLYTSTMRYVYTVDHIEYVSTPEMDLTVDPKKPQMLVLISTHPYQRDTDWIIVYAFLSGHDPL